MSILALTYLSCSVPARTQKQETSYLEKVMTSPWISQTGLEISRLNPVLFEHQTPNTKDLLEFKIYNNSKREICLRNVDLTEIYPNSDHPYPSILEYIVLTSSNEILFTLPPAQYSLDLGVLPIHPKERKSFVIDINFTKAELNAPEGAKVYFIQILHAPECDLIDENRIGPSIDILHSMLLSANPEFPGIKEQLSQYFSNVKGTLYWISEELILKDNVWKPRIHFEHP